MLTLLYCIDAEKEGVLEVIKTISLRNKVKSKTDRRRRMGASSVNRLGKVSI